MSIEHARWRHLQFRHLTQSLAAEVSWTRTNYAGPRCAKNAKKQHLYIKNKKFGPTIHVRQWLHFITAIFVAFNGALAEEFMCLCRHARTELYIECFCCSLQALHIHNNHLRTLPSEMVSLRKLFILVLAFNHFEVVPPVVPQLTDVRVSEVGVVYLH